MPPRLYFTPFTQNLFVECQTSGLKPLWFLCYVALSTFFGRGECLQGLPIHHAHFFLCCIVLTSAAATWPDPPGLNQCWHIYELHPHCWFHGWAGQFPQRCSTKCFALHSHRYRGISFRFGFIRRASAVLWSPSNTSDILLVHLLALTPFPCSVVGHFIPFYFIFSQGWGLEYKMEGDGFLPKSNRGLSKIQKFWQEE